METSSRCRSQPDAHSSRCSGPPSAQRPAPASDPAPPAPALGPAHVHSVCRAKARAGSPGGPRGQLPTGGRRGGPVIGRWSEVQHKTVSNDIKPAPKGRLKRLRSKRSAQSLLRRGEHPDISRDPRQSPRGHGLHWGGGVHPLPRGHPQPGRCPGPGLDPETSAQGPPPTRSHGGQGAAPLSPAQGSPAPRSPASPPNASRQRPAEERGPLTLRRPTRAPSGQPSLAAAAAPRRSRPRRLHN